MRILAVEFYPTSKRGGSEKAYFEILTRLKKKGHEIVLAFCKRGDLVDQYEEAGISCVQIERTNIQNYFSLDEWRQLHSSYRKVRNRFDVIYLNYLNDTPFGLLCKLLSRRKLVCHIRVSNITNCRQFRFTGKFVDNFIFLNKKQQFTYKTDYPKNFSTVISDGLEVKLANRLPAPASWSAVYLGRLSPEKGLSDLIDTWKILKNQYRLSIPLTITGPIFSEEEKQYYKDICQMIRAANLERTIVISPAVSDPVSYLQQFSFSVFPSIIEETFGRTLVESVLAGRPVFARNIGVTGEILQPEKDKLVFTDTQDMAHKIYQYVSGEAKVNLEDLQHHVLKNYDIADKIDRVEQLLRKNCITSVTAY